jgi:formylglycine-generating enzyme required for sulfatase activity
MMTSIERLRQQLQLDDRPLAFVIGAGLSSGIPDAAGMVELVRAELNLRGLGQRFERELGGVEALGHYAAALNFIETQAGPWLVDALVDEAVRMARRSDAPVDFEGDGRPEHWHLPRGLVGLARLLVGRPAATVLTTNFDPLLSLAIEAAGGLVNRRVLLPDGTLEPSGSSGEVLHLHGYWRGRAEVRHRRDVLLPDEESQTTIRTELCGRRIVVVGHRGRAGPLMDALEQLAINADPGTELWWCFDAPERTPWTVDPALLERLANWRANVLFGVDAHQLFGDLASAPTRPPRGDRFTDERTGIEFVRIPGGSFKMGSPPTEKDRDDDEGPQHEVVLDDFYLARTPVTNAQYARFLKKRPDAPKPRYWDNREYNQPEQPVVGVSWTEAQKYCDWANLKLPTEAQWEYACRAGTTTPYWSGDKESDLARAGWYKGNADGRTHPVGEKEANPFGLHDTHGNVWEWCWDKFGPYADRPPRPKDGLRYEPGDEDGGAMRVIRGGSWSFGARFARSAFRYDVHPGVRYGIVGFRPAQGYP